MGHPKELQAVIVNFATLSFGFFLFDKIYLSVREMLKIVLDGCLCVKSFIYMTSFCILLISA